ncbi:hypothetical protein LSAT2_033023 [Lamellibrachia satsuma]|nr:hypothetical protein LSAT2_000090 [Lamellibrachia satsuma]KAI0214963.1 hypothetical protein LSAT2_033023 [Lamellibrachia satsuma]
MNSLLLLVVLLVGVTVSQADKLQRCMKECAEDFKRCIACPETKGSLCQQNKKLCEDMCFGLYGGGDEDYEDIF